MMSVDELLYIEVVASSGSKASSCSSELAGRELKNSQLCAIVPANTPGKCHGDAGSPLLCYDPAQDTSDRVLAGLLSWRSECNPNKPVVFEGISYNLDFLRGEHKEIDGYYLDMESQEKTKTPHPDKSNIATLIIVY